MQNMEKKTVEKCEKYKIKFLDLKHLLHETNYVLGKYSLRLNEKICTLHWNPSPTHNIHNVTGKHYKRNNFRFNQFFFSNNSK